MTFLLDLPRKLLCLVLITNLTLLGQASAQQPPPPSAPVPAQILQAHTVFLANAGGDPFFAFFSGGPDRAYNDVYAGLKQWVRVTIVASPQQADLILEIRSRSNASTSGGADSSPVYTPELELRLLDPASHTTLWTLNSYLNGSLARQKTRDRTLDQAATVLVDQLRQLTGEQLTPAQAKAASRRPGPTRRTTLIYLGITAVAVVVPLAIVLSMRHSQPKLPAPPSFPAPF